MPDPIYARIVAASDAAGLLVMGALHPARVGAKGDLAGTLILLGAGPGFWPAFTASPEATDDRPDPVDRWSTRVVGDLAKGYRASALFPFGGPPYQPFLDWAVKSGRAWQSPVGMLVHDTVGLMISFRGALHLDAEIAIPNAAADAPCRTCIGQPCATACPVSALSAKKAYDVPACHAFLDTEAGGDCLARGCAVRRACPISLGAGRSDAQSALHMRSFHPS
jgi:hypothetical protein